MFSELTYYLSIRTELVDYIAKIIFNYASNHSPTLKRYRIKFLLIVCIIIVLYITKCPQQQSTKHQLSRKKIGNN